MPGLPTRNAPTAVIANPMSVRPFGVRPSRPIASAIGSKTFLIRPRDSLEMVMIGGQPATPRMARSRAANSVKASSRRRQIVSRPRRRVTTTPAARRRPRCQRDERLAEPDVLDQLGDRGLAIGEPAHDAQPVDVGHDLVEGTQLAQVVGLDRRPRRSCRGPGRARGTGLGLRLGGWCTRGTSTTVYINRSLMLRVSAARCQEGQW